MELSCPPRLTILAASTCDHQHRSSLNPSFRVFIEVPLCRHDWSLVIQWSVIWDNDEGPDSVSRPSPLPRVWELKVPTSRHAWSFWKPPFWHYLGTPPTSHLVTYKGITQEIPRIWSLLSQKRGHSPKLPLLCPLSPSLLFPSLSFLWHFPFPTDLLL